MKRLLLAAALAGLAGAPAASATPTLNFGACVPGSFPSQCAPTSTILGAPLPLLSVPATTVGSFSVSGSASAGIVGSNAIFDSQTITISSTTGGLIDVYFTVDGVPTLGNPLLFTSTFTSNQQNADTHSVVENTYLSNTDGLFDNGTGTLLATATLNNAVLETAGPFTTLTTPATTISLTHLYQIELTGCGDQGGGLCTANLTIDLAVAPNVPEPASLALLGVSLIGLGFVRRRFQS